MRHGSKVIKNNTCPWCGKTVASLRVEQRVSYIQMGAYDLTGTHVNGPYSWNVNTEPWKSDHTYYCPLCDGRIRLPKGE